MHFYQAPDEFLDMLLQQRLQYQFSSYKSALLEKEMNINLEFLFQEAKMLYNSERKIPHFRD